MGFPLKGAPEGAPAGGIVPEDEVGLLLWGLLEDGVSGLESLRRDANYEKNGFRIQH